MPTARALQTVIKNLGTDDPAMLTEVTGLGTQQVERCRLILSYPTKYQALSMEGDKSKRIPSNFWVELHPVLELISKELPDLVKNYGRDGLIDRMVAKYRAKRIRSVIHFRRIMEADEVQESDEGRDEFLDQLRNYVLDENWKPEKAFDRFIVDTRRVTKVADASATFIKAMEAAKISHASEGRSELIDSLRQVLRFVEDLLSKLEGEDPPNQKEA